MQSFFHSQNWVSAITSEVDKYAHLNSNGQYISVANNPLLQITGDMTFSAWIKPVNTNIRRNIFGKAYAGEGAMVLERNNTLNYYYGHAGGNSGSLGSSYSQITSNSLIPLNYWTCVHVVRKMNNNLKIFLGGVLDNSVPITMLCTASTLPFLIGMGHTASLYGDINDVKLWNRALTDAEVAADVAAIYTSPQPGLVGYWKLNGNTQDSSGNSLHGNVIAGPLTYENR